MSVAAAWMLDRQVRMQIDRLRRYSLVGQDTLLVLERRAHAFASRWIDVALIVIAVAGGQVIVWHVTQGLVGEEISHRGPAAILYGSITWPLFAFAGMRYLVRWAAWVTMIVRISREQLKLEPMHPDRVGGLAPIVRPVDSFLFFVFGMNAVAGAAWSDAVLAGRTHLAALVEPFALLMAIAVLIGFLPYLLFTPQLVRAQRRGLRDYGRLSQVYVLRFRDRWVVPTQPGPDLLGTPDIQSLSDIGQSFVRVQTMRFVALSPRDLLLLVFAGLLPMIPVVLLELPLSHVLKTAFHLIVG
jgi:hypothetical protein